VGTVIEEDLGIISKSVMCQQQYCKNAIPINSTVQYSTKSCSNYIIKILPTVLQGAYGCTVLMLLQRTVRTVWTILYPSSTLLLQSVYYGQCDLYSTTSLFENY